MFRLWSIFSFVQSVAALITFVDSPMNLTVFQDGIVVLRCIAATTASRDAVHISWFKDGDVVSVNSGILSLPLVRCDDAGWYTCVASDGSETAERTAYLTVLCGTAPSFVRALSPNYSFTNVWSLGDAAVIQCTAKGDPPPDVRWEKEGQRLPSSPSTEGPYATEGTLHLMSSLPRDSGAYRCVAENRLATIVQNTTVTIAEEAPPLWQSWWMLSLYCAVVIVVLLGVPLSIKLVVEWCRKMAEEEDLADTQRRGPWGIENPGAAPAVVLTSTRESFFHEGGELSMFANGDQTAIQEEEMGKAKEEVLVGWTEEDVVEQTANRDDGDKYLQTGEEVGEVLVETLMVEVNEERLSTEEGEGVKVGEEVREERKENREGVKRRERRDSQEEIQARATVKDKVMQDREEGGMDSVMRSDKMKVEKSLRRSTQVESQIYEFTFDQCDSDDTQDSEGDADDQNKMLH